MFDYLFTVIGPLGSALVLATFLITAAFVVGLANVVGSKKQEHKLGARST